MKKVFVSGCFDILHGGHIEFFKQAKSLGDYLIVSFASDEVLFKYKNRKPSIPEQHKFNILSELSVVDQVVIGTNLSDEGIDFEEPFKKCKPDILAVTEDDKYEKEKRQLCEKCGVKYVSLPKTLNYKKTSSSSIVNNIKTPSQCPLRVDFAGGWLDVPKIAKEYGGYIVNCAIEPLVSLNDWIYEQNSGLGGSAAWAYLNGKDGVESELDMGVGWQDPAIVSETGFCVWKAGARPKLLSKIDPKFLEGRMALLYTGKQHNTQDLAKQPRDYESIAKNSTHARWSCFGKERLKRLVKSVRKSYEIQLKEGMEELPDCEYALAKKYCGSGHGGYALYLFNSRVNRDKFSENENVIKIEPYIRQVNK
jgi:cytidyltransferase-like protein